MTLFDLSDFQNLAITAVARQDAGGFNHLDLPRGLAFAGDHLLVAAQASYAVTMVQFASRPASLSSQGWVGIGTSRPAGALHVVGDVFVEQAGRIKFNTRHFEAGYSAAASGDNSVAMGYFAKASGAVSTAMGQGTTASGNVSMAMGVGTTASGAVSTAMGEGSVARGIASVALGSYARAIHDGSFVWADRLGEDFDSTATNQFSLRASGGVRLSNETTLSFGNQTRQMINLYDSAYAIGVQTAAAYFRTDAEFFWYRGGSHSDAFGDAGEGGAQLMRLGNTGNLIIAGTVSSASDRNVKQGFADVDSREVLEKVVALPIQSWTYKTDAGIRHLGPVAQDFHAAFGLNGDDDKHIATVDADGVALAAIKGLNEKLEAEMQSKDARIAELEKRLATIEALLKK